MGALSSLRSWAGEGVIAPFVGLLLWTTALFAAFDFYTGQRIAEARASRLEVSGEDMAARAKALEEQNKLLLQELHEALQLAAAPEAQGEEQARGISLVRSTGSFLPMDAIAVAPSQHEAAAAWDPLQQPLLSNPRRLAALFGVVSTNTASSGCYAFTSTAQDAVVSATSCLDSNRCPSCFIATSLSSAGTLRIGQCSSAIVGSAALSNQVLEYTFINADSADALTVEAHATTDFSGSAASSKSLAASSSTRAYCYSGGSHVLYFPA